MKLRKKLVELSAKNRYVVVLDDDPTIHKYIEKCLGFKSTGFSNGDLFLAKFKQLRPLGFFIDVNLIDEERNGIQLVPIIRSVFPNIPIFVITSDLDENLIASALESGADDFIKKPICMIELKSRFNARLISIREREKNSTLRFADLALDPISGHLKGNGYKRILSSLDSKILSLLMKAQGETVSKELLKQEAWGNHAINDNALSRRIYEVRLVVKQLSRSLRLRSCYGKGFRLLRDKK